ncbi:unnamed protein product [Lactuca virosa]|uniref:Uncharacterized protein n=1 Tax=Lactuca virosa TaxID=75947 RepID=A0AAU9MSN4_9ASTR|nr:unnamed protein product [Lactuca virosa]
MLGCRREGMKDVNKQDLNKFEAMPTKTCTNLRVLRMLFWGRVQMQKFLPDPFTSASPTPFNSRGSLVCQIEDNGSATWFLQDLAREQGAEGNIVISFGEVTEKSAMLEAPVLQFRNLPAVITTTTVILFKDKLVFLGSLCLLQWTRYNMLDCMKRWDRETELSRRHIIIVGAIRTTCPARETLSASRLGRLTPSIGPNSAVKEFATSVGCPLFTFLVNKKLTSEKQQWQDGCLRSTNHARNVSDMRQTTTSKR